VKPDESRHDPPESAPPKPAPDKNRPAFGLDDADILLYVEAVTRIKDEAIRLGPNITRAQIVGQSLRALLARKDLCCDYLTREEYRRFKESLNESYVGIGMEITQDRNGRTIGLPLPESPAARAGIARGSELRSIDGVRVDGKSLFNVAALARGKPGTKARVAIATRDGREREFSITRGALTLPSVSMRTVEGSPVIVLSHFTRGTKATLTDALKNWPRDVPIIIDLRGMVGAISMPPSTRPCCFSTKASGWCPSRPGRARGRTKAGSRWWIGRFPSTSGRTKERPVRRRCSWRL
jgi:carboxyl-terminal processing protease